MKTNYEVVMERMNPEFLAELISDYRSANACKYCHQKKLYICDHYCERNILEWLNVPSEEKDVHNSVSS